MLCISTLRNHWERARHKWRVWCPNWYCLHCHLILKFKHMIPVFHLNSERFVSEFLNLLQEDIRQKLVNSDNKVRQLETQVSEAQQASANARKVNMLFVPAYIDKHIQIDSESDI